MSKVRRAAWHYEQGGLASLEAIYADGLPFALLSGLETYLSVTGLVRAHEERERRKELERERDRARSAPGRMNWRR